MSPLRGVTLAGLPKKYPENGAVRKAKLEHLTEIYSLIELLESNDNSASHILICFSLLNPGVYKDLEFKVRTF
jgi:hypothetical protein